MLNNNLPTFVDAARFAEKGANLHGTLAIKDMPRLLSSLASQDGEVVVDANFGIDKQGIKFIKGSVKALVYVLCARCLEVFVQEIISDFSYGVVDTDAKAKKLPAHYEPVLMTTENLNVLEMVEDELIINLPIVPKHDPKFCKIQMPVVVLEDPKAAQETKKTNPFSVIESLKVKPKQK
jgi:uncharacterized protein